MKESLALANKIVATAKKELADEREKNLTTRAKSLLQDIQEAKRTVSLLEKQLNNFVREIQTD